MNIFQPFIKKICLIQYLIITIAKRKQLNRCTNLKTTFSLKALFQFLYVKSEPTITILESQEWSFYTGLTVLNLFLRLLVFYYLRYIKSERLYFPGSFYLFKQRKILGLSPEAKGCRRWRDIRQGPARCQSWWGRRLEGSGRKKEAFAPPENHSNNTVNVASEEVFNNKRCLFLLFSQRSQFSLILGLVIRFQTLQAFIEYHSLHRLTIPGSLCWTIRIIKYGLPTLSQIFLF